MGEQVAEDELDAGEQSVERSGAILVPTPKSPWQRLGPKARHVGLGTALATTIGYLQWVDWSHLHTGHVLTIALLAICDGFGLATSIRNGEVAQLVNQRDWMREEIRRLAAENKEFQRLVLQNRISSAPPDPSPPAGGGPTFPSQTPGGKGKTQRKGNNKR